jgi:hypothetical protein
MAELVRRRLALLLRLRATFTGAYYYDQATPPAKISINSLNINGAQIGPKFYSTNLSCKFCLTKTQAAPMSTLNIIINILHHLYIASIGSALLRNVVALSAPAPLLSMIMVSEVRHWFDSARCRINLHSKFGFYLRQRSPATGPIL